MPSLSFLRSIFPVKHFSSAATSYGIAQEKNAKQAYITKTGNHLHDCGLVINPMFPFLGASPDAKVCENNVSGIIEVKCPYTARDLTISEALDKLKHNLCIERDDASGHINMKQNHLYWYQIQGQLLVTGAPFCDLVIFTRKDLFIKRIVPHNPTMKNIVDVLLSFYTDHALPYLKQNTTKD